MEKFSEIKYVRPDIATYEKEMNALLDRFESAESYEEAKKIYLELDAKDNAMGDMITVCHIRNTINKADEFYDKEMQFLDSELPKLMPLNKRSSMALLNSKFKADFEKEFGKVLTEGEEKTLCLKDERIIPDVIKENELKQEYSKIAASCKTNFRGEECNFYGLLKHMQSTDRVERKEAFEAWSALYESVADKLESIYDELVKIRVKKAATLGFDNFADMALISNNHFDYTTKDVENFRKQVVEIIVPAAAKLYKEQAERIGVDKLRFYDEQLIFPEGNANPQGTKDEMVGWAQEMYAELSPETKEFFDFMVNYELFDLETKPNKHLGGYMTLMGERKAPFIFSNFNGTSADVEVLTHEAGHAFQGYTAARIQPLSNLVMSTSDISEIHSMTMEHLTYPWMDKFFGENVDKFRFAHLSEAIKVIPYLCAVDEYQYRVYEKPEMTAMERRAAWKKIESIYLPWRDYDGNEFMETGAFWMQKQHIFLYPFYYVDYALAQLCAFDLFGKVCEDREKGWNAYLTLCKNGGSMSYTELLKASGIRNPFEDGSVEAAISGALKQLEIFKSKLN